MMPNKFEALVLTTLMILVVGGAFIFRLSSTKNLSRSQQPINLNGLTGEFDPTDIWGEFYGQKVTSQELPDSHLAQKVMGTNDEPKRIEVDLTNQRLYAFEGNNKIYDFLISSGKWGRTPTGTFRIQNKFRYTKMSGGSAALHTYYYLPNVPFVMFFGNAQIPASKGFSLHGTYWHSNFGHPMSHGCVNMKTEEAELIYNWSGPSLGDKKSGAASKDNQGTEIIIYGVTPRE